MYWKVCPLVAILLLMGASALLCPREAAWGSAGLHQVPAPGWQGAWGLVPISAGQLSWHCGNWDASC